MFLGHLRSPPPLTLILSTQITVMDLYRYTCLSTSVSLLAKNSVRFGLQQGWRAELFVGGPTIALTVYTGSGCQAIAEG